MKKIITVTAVLCLALAMLASCGSTTSNVNIEDVKTAVLAVAPIDEPVDITEDDLVYEMDITMENIEAYAGTRSNVSGNGDVVLVIKAVSGKADTVKAELEKERASTAEFLKSYEDFAMNQKKAEAGRVVAKGDIVMLVIGGDNSVVEAKGAEAAYADIDKAIDEALK